MKGNDFTTFTLSSQLFLITDGRLDSKYKATMENERFLPSSLWTDLSDFADHVNFANFSFF